MQNGITAVSLALGDALTPQLKQAVVALMPYLKQTEKFVGITLSWSGRLRNLLFLW